MPSSKLKNTQILALLYDSFSHDASKPPSDTQRETSLKQVLFKCLVMGSQEEKWRSGPLPQSVVSVSNLLNIILNHSIGLQGCHEVITDQLNPGRFWGDIQISGRIKGNQFFFFSLQVPTDFLACTVNSHFKHKGKDGLSFQGHWLIAEVMRGRIEAPGVLPCHLYRELRKRRGQNSYFTNPWSKITLRIWASNRDKSTSFHFLAYTWMEEMLFEEECHCGVGRGKKDESRWGKVNSTI